MRVLVVGGGGFIGQHICRRLVQGGASVISLTRSGNPFIGSSEEHNVEWAHSVQWETGDALQPETYREVLFSCDKIVHAVGMIFEGDYKTFLDTAKIKRVPFQAGQDSFERSNCETALAVATEAAACSSVDTFLYLSSAQPPPGLIDPRHLISKRSAEDGIFQLAAAENENNDEQKFRPIIFRPGLVYSEQRPLTMALAGASTLLSTVANSLETKMSNSIVDEGYTGPPLSKSKSSVDSNSKMDRGNIDFDEEKRSSRNNQNFSASSFFPNTNFFDCALPATTLADAVEQALRADEWCTGILEAPDIKTLSNCCANK
eukprot:g5770.t1